MKKIFAITTLFIWAGIGFSQFNENVTTFNFSKEQPLKLNLKSDDELGGGKSNVITSLIVPGLGLWRVTKQPIWIAFAPICYGLVGFGTMTRLGAQVQYNNYKNEKNPLEQTVYFDKANDKKALGNKLLGIGTALWILQAGWTYIYGSYNDIYRERNKNWKDKISLMPVDYDFATRSFFFSTTIKL